MTEMQDRLRIRAAESAASNKSNDFSKINRLYGRERIYKRARSGARQAYPKAIPRGWHIHHIDGNHRNNFPDNLVCLTIEQHIKIHAKQGDEKATRLLMRQKNYVEGRRAEASND